MKILFIGNSATYVHEIPGMLSDLAKTAGYDVEVAKITRGGFTLAKHADASTEHGQRVLAEIEKGYDIVFLQEVGNCFTTEEHRESCRRSTRILLSEIQKSGAKAWFYVRPPYGRDLEGYPAFDQSRELDRLFVPLAAENHTPCAYVNRAFADAMKHTDIGLWGPDNAHTSIPGAYLIACTLFSALFGRSATALKPEIEGLSAEEALILARIADHVSLEGYSPWKD